MEDLKKTFASSNADVVKALQSSNLNDALLKAFQELTEVQRDILQELRDRPITGVSSTNSSLGTGNSQNFPVQIGSKTTYTPKLDFAVKWLQMHPEDVARSGRDLETNVLMDGDTVSYKTWNKAKKEL